MEEINRAIFFLHKDKLRQNISPVEYLPKLPATLPDLPVYFPLDLLRSPRISL